MSPQVHDSKCKADSEEMIQLIQTLESDNIGSDGLKNKDGLDGGY